MTAFEVKDCALLVRMSGLPPAFNLRELRDRIAVCGENVLFHHYLRDHAPGHLRSTPTTGTTSPCGRNCTWKTVCSRSVSASSTPTHSIPSGNFARRRSR